MRKAGFLGVVLCVLACTEGVALAQSERATAEALFRAGREANARGDYATACRRFEESNRLEPAVGTILNVANCREKLGQLPTAWQRYQEAVQKLPAGDERATVAGQRAAALEPRLPHLTLTLAAGAPASATILKDGTELGSGSLDVPLPVDPGEHSVIVRALGYEDAKYVVTLAEAESKSLELAPGKPKPNAEGSGVVLTPGVGQDNALTPAPAERAPSSSQRTIGYVVGGVGVAALATSLVTGAIVLSKKSTVEDNCQNKRCTQEALDAADSGKTLGTVSTVAFVAGVAGIGAGLALVLTSNEKSGANTTVGATAFHGGGGLRFGGSF